MSRDPDAWVAAIAAVLLFVALGVAVIFESAPPSCSTDSECGCAIDCLEPAP